METRRVLCGVVLACVLTPPILSEIKKKKEPARAVKDEAKEQKGTPKKLEPADAARVKALSMRLRDWEESATFSDNKGLRLEGFLAPDALSFKVASSYLELRKKGQDHSAAVTELAKKLPRWKRYEKKCLFLLELRNDKFKLSKSDRRLFTLESSLHKEGLKLTDLRGRVFPIELGGYPSHLRLAKLRVKRFWVTADGFTRRVRPPDDPDRRDPASIGRKSKISKAINALVLEEKPSQVEILVPRRIVERSRTSVFQLHLLQWKRYEGPFENDLLDLNLNRAWKTLKDLSLKIELPPSGLGIRPEVRTLVDEVRAASRR